MIETKNLLNDEATPANVKAAILAAWRDPSAVTRAQLVLNAMRALIDKAGMTSVLQSAVLESLEGSASVVDLLRERELAVIAEINSAIGQRRAYEDKCAVRHGEIQPLLNRCVGESLSLGEQAKLLESRIGGFNRARDSAKERYEAAGLSAADIEALGIRPTDADLAAWKQELEANRERQATVNQFLKSGPEYPEHILDGIKAEA